MENTYTKMITKEMNKLAFLLGQAKIPFEIYPYCIGEMAYFQICYPNKENCRIDAVATQFTYGGREGLIEILDETIEGEDGDGVIGWLTAEEAFDHFKEVSKHYICE